MIERRHPPFAVEQAKFATQKCITYVLLIIFAGVVADVMGLGVDQSERSMVLQTVINLTLLAAGYWLGSSKGAADSNETLRTVVKPSEPAVTPAPIDPKTGIVPAVQAQTTKGKSK